MALELRDYLLTDAGVAVSGWTVNLRTGRKTGAAGAVLFSTTTSADGMWEFVNGSGGVTLVAGTKYDVQATNGTSERWWRGYTAIPQEFTDLQVAAAAGIVLTKLDEGTADDTVDPTTAVTTLEGRISQFAALLKRLSGGSTFSAAPTRGPANSLTNGDFTVWQRGTSFVSPAANAYVADRWQWVTIGAGAVTITRDTDAPTVGSNAIHTPYSCKVDVTTADAAIAAGDLYALFTVIEGYDYRPLTNGLAISFWVKAAKTGIHCVAVFNSGPDRSWVAEYTVSAANTWEYKTVVITTPPTAGTWDYSTGKGLYVSFALAAGSTFQTTAGAWQTGNFYATANQVDELDNTANNFFVALVNVVPGSVATPLVPMPAQQQLARCQRYCQVFGGGNTSDGLATGFCVSATAARGRLPFLTSMRLVPTLTISSAGHFDVISSSTTTITGLTMSAGDSSPYAAMLSATVAAGLTAWQPAFISANTASATLTFVSNP